MTSRSIRLGLRALLVAALYLCLLSAHTHAIISNWNTDASGSFTTAANWDKGVPDSDDTAEFNRGFVAYTVSFPGNSFASPPRHHVVRNLIVRTNEITLADSPIFLQPAIVTVAASDSSEDSIVIGKLSGDVAILNTTLSSLSGAFARVGLFQGAAGTFNVSAGMVTLTDMVVGFEGIGTVNITGTGRVSTDLGVGIGLSFGAVGSGTVTVRGASSSLRAGGDITLANAGSGTLNVMEGGAVTSESGKIGFNGGFGGTGTVHVEGSGSKWTNMEDLMVGGPFRGIGQLDITNGGKVSSKQGSIGNDPNGGTSTVTISGAGSKWTNTEGFVLGDAGRGALTIIGGGTLTSGHSIIADQDSSNGVATVAGPGSTWANTGNLTVGGLGTATLNIFGGGSLSNVHAFIGTTAAPLSIISVEGAGSIWQSAGDVTIGHQGNGNSGMLILSDGGIATVDGLLVVEPTGLVTGNSIADANIINRGDVRPGLSAGTSSGALHVDGSYLQSQSGRLTVRLGGTMPAAQYDQLQVTGAVTLSGTLSVVLANSFQPSLGNVFDILDGSSINGTFSTIQLPALAAGLNWNTSQLYSTGTLSVVSSGIPGDYNGNGAVDAADYLLWRNGGPLQNEVDTPGVINAADYTAWRARFGNSGTGADTNLNAVPEPGITVLLIILAATCVFSRQCQIV
jgi:T5SS/PEP-CTERM-associated repeat protein